MFSKSCKYAIRAVLFLATSSSNDRKVGVEELSMSLSVPKHFLAKILQQLVRHNLVSSAKGRNGGFYLSEANRESTLLSVIDSIDGPGTFDECVLGLQHCSNEAPCPYHNTFKIYRNQFHQLVSTETIAESAVRIKNKNLKLKI